MKSFKKISKNKRNNKSKNMLSKKRGSELAQTILITAIMIMLIATIFFPQIQSIFTSAMTKVSSWFNTALGAL